MSTMLFVTNLPLSVTKETLIGKFARFGTVLSARLGRNAQTGQGDRSGFVEMNTPADAQAAINGLNLANYDGRLLAVYRAVTAASVTQ